MLIKNMLKLADYLETSNLDDKATIDGLRACILFRKCAAVRYAVGNGEIMDIFCPVCGNVLEDGSEAKFCPECGQALDWTEVKDFAADTISDETLAASTSIVSNSYAWPIIDKLQSDYAAAQGVEVHRSTLGGTNV